MLGGGVLILTLMLVQYTRSGEYICRIRADARCVLPKRSRCGLLVLLRVLPPLEYLQEVTGV